MSVSSHPAPLQRTVDQLRAGDRLLTDYVADLCNRIAAANPDLRAMVPEPDRDDRLLAAAERHRERYSGGTDQPALAGVPVGVKDIIHVDGFTTEAGSAMPPELFAGPEASAVSALRDAGALIAGKTATTEFAGAAPARTRNPHDLTHTPGGSSSGSAAAVAAGLCPLALGTQTGGSVIRPAAFCGIVGFKPSFGRVPRDGVLERSVSADHVGWFTQDVAGSELAATVLCPEWTGTPDSPDRPPRIGVPKGSYLEQASRQGRTAFEEQLNRLEATGCAVRRVDIPAFRDFDALDRRHKRMVRAELAMVHDTWFDEYRAFYRTPMADAIERGREITTADLARARQSRLELRSQLNERLDACGVDLWAAPAAPGPAPATITTTGDPVMNRPWTHAGVPVLGLPAGTASNGLPVGVQFAGSFGEDEELLAWGSELRERLSPASGDQRAAS